MELQSELLLKEKGIKYRLIKLSHSAYTINDVKAYSGGDINFEEIVKTIILRGKKSGNKAAILLRGKDRIDFLKAKIIFGEEMTVANKEEVREVAGVEPGAVCPLLLNIALLVDSNVANMNNINFGSGNHLYGLEIRVEDLSKVVNYKIVEISKSI